MSIRGSLVRMLRFVIYMRMLRSVLDITLINLLISDLIQQ